MLKGEVRVDVAFDSEEESGAVFAALGPEISATPSDRTRVEAECRGEELSLVFQASDSASLRASINSYMRWIMAGVDLLALGRSD
jgi:KEOPS complex subunit Pcc1